MPAHGNLPLQSGGTGFLQGMEMEYDVPMTSRQWECCLLAAGAKVVG